MANSNTRYRPDDSGETGLRSLLYESRPKAFITGSRGGVRIAGWIAGAIFAVLFLRFGWTVVKEGFAVAYQRGTHTKIACDICGRAIDEYYTGDFHLVSPSGLGDQVTGAVAAFAGSGNTSNTSDSDTALEKGRHYEYCTTCYHDFIVAFHAAKSSSESGG